ncbi:chaperonin 10-like protein [Phellopilus nigrolimitatus]|nr:chaperonin 10-like protein [Phellopilus nigrolimitatus]
MQALVTLSDSQAGVRSVAIPQPGANQIRVRVKVAALNPVDALYVAKPAAPPGRVVGSDFAGVVETVGEDAKGAWKKGARVAGFLHGACQENDLPGAFAEFLSVDADLVYGIPDTMSFEEAATLPLCINTASNGIYRVLSLPAPWDLAQSPTSFGKRPAIIIYSGATSVGCYAIQLARLSPANLLILTTASPDNAAYLRSLGADHVLDYHTPDWAAQVARITEENNAELLYGLDCISEGPTVGALSQAFKDKGKIATVRGPTQWDGAAVKAGVVAEYMAVWTLLGREFWYNGGIHFPAEPAHRALAASLYAYISDTNPASPIVSGALRANKVRLMPGGLADVPEAFVLLGSGRVTERKETATLRSLRAEKMVYRLEK